MRLLYAAALTACSVVSASAQSPPPAPSATRPPAFAFRAFGLATVERFTAGTTFNATLGSRVAPFFGGGVELATSRGIFVDLTVSRMSKDGQRAFVNNGEIFQLGIPLRVRLTPIEVSGGYRVKLRRHPRIAPYAGGGVGWYRYSETAGFASNNDDVQTTHAGWLVVGGAEVRLRRWIGVAADAQYTRVPGILGQGGLSKDINEKDLGGVAARIRVILGR